MDTKEINRLRDIDFSESLEMIKKAIRSEYPPTIVAFAYVLYLAAATPDVHLHTMVEFFRSVNVSPNRKLFIEGSIQNNWKAVRKLAFTIEPDVLKAIILFAEPVSYGMEYDSLSTPAGVCRLAARLLDIRKDESVIDLGSGVGNFLRESVVIQPEALYTGLEINTYLCEMTVIRSEIMDKKITVKHGDILSVNDKHHDLYDKVFSHYPWGMRYRHFFSEPSETLKKITEKFSTLRKVSSSDWYYNAVLVSLMKEHGKAAAIMPFGSSFKNMDKEVRQQFVSSGLIETVILLPNDLFPNTRIQTLMVLFSHNNQSIRMVDASDFCIKNRGEAAILTKENIDSILKCCGTDSNNSRSVPVSELKQNNYELNPEIYLESPVTVVDGIELKQLVKAVNRGAQLSSSDLDSIKSDEPTDTEYLMLKDITNGMIERNLPYIQPNDKFEKFLLKPNSLIISKNTNPTKICVADIEPDRKIVASGNLYIMELDETKANPYYIKAFLESSAGRKSIEKVSTGSVIKIISLEKLQKIMIPMIPIEEQNRFGIEYQAAMDEVRVLKVKTEKAVDRLEHLFDFLGEVTDEKA